MAKQTISNVAELCKLIEKKYRGRITDVYQNVSFQGHGRLEALLDGQQFMISFTDEFLIASTFNGDTKTLEKLMPVLKKVMGNEEPLCSYDIKCEGLLNPTVEWEVKDPKGRLKEIANGRAFDSAEISNLKLYNSEKIEDYLETEEEKAEKIKNAKIYGIYPGCLKDLDAVAKLNELELFVNVECLGGHIWWCNHQMNCGRIEPIDLTEEQYALEYLVYQTTKFGVELAEPTLDKHVQKTPSYMAWYQFWYNHYQSLSNLDIAEYQAARQQGEDTSKFMPKGSWKDSFNESNGDQEKPAQKVKTTNNPKNS